MSRKLDNKNIKTRLLKAFEDGATDEQACFIVGISSDSLYRYCREHEDFFIAKQKAKQALAISAKELVKREIKKGNVRVAQWYLERVCRDEFSTKIEQENIEPVRVFVRPEEIIEADAIINKITDAK